MSRIFKDTFPSKRPRKKKSLSLVTEDRSRGGKSWRVSEQRSGRADWPVFCARNNREMSEFQRTRASNLSENTRPSSRPRLAPSGPVYIIPNTVIVYVTEIIRLHVRREPHAKLLAQQSLPLESFGISLMPAFDTCQSGLFAEVCIVFPLTESIER